MHAVDHEDLDGCPGGFQLHSDILNRGEERGRTGFGWLRNGGRRAELEIDVKQRGEPGLIENDAIGLALQQAEEL